MKEIESKIKKYLCDRGWDKKIQPADLAKSISIESAELLECFQWDNPNIETVKKDKKKISEIKNEVADVLIYCFDLSVILGFDVKKIILEKLKHVEKKYPAKIMKSSTDNINYWKIKNEHRKNKK